MLQNGNRQWRSASKPKGKITEAGRVGTKCWNSLTKFRCQGNPAMPCSFNGDKMEPLPLAYEGETSGMLIQGLPAGRPVAIENGLQRSPTEAVLAGIWFSHQQAGRTRKTAAAVLSGIRCEPFLLEEGRASPDPWEPCSPIERVRIHNFRRKTAN